jgi:hypothetical protein
MVTFCRDVLNHGVEIDRITCSYSVEGRHYWIPEVVKQTFSSDLPIYISTCIHSLRIFKEHVF